MSSDADFPMLRGAAAADLPAIARLLEAAGLPVAGIADHLGSFVVFEDGGRPVAAGGLERYGEVALLRSIVVADRYRGSGLGSRICDRLELAARAGGIREIYLLTDTAEEFFRRRGYARVERNSAPTAIASTQEFTTLCPASATLMRIRIADAPA